MKPLLVLLSGMTLLAGCMVGVPGHLYPIQGPLATHNPTPIYKVSMSGVYKSGTMSATLQDGAVFSGHWGAIGQDDPSASSMAADWDRVYGAGFFVANVLGNPVFARADLTGPNGAVLNVQLYDPKPGNVSAVVGVARDSSGNVYKLTF